MTAAHLGTAVPSHLSHLSFNQSLSLHALMQDHLVLAKARESFMVCRKERYSKILLF